MSARFVWSVQGSPCRFGEALRRSRSQPQVCSVACSRSSSALSLGRRCAVDHLGGPTPGAEAVRLSRSRRDLRLRVFGVVATVGTTYVLLEEVQTLSLVASVAVGLWATALLVINNLRDIPGDTDAGKNTLAVRIGARAARVVFAAMHVAALGFALWAAFGFDRWGGLMVVLGLGQMIQAVVDVQKGATGPDLVKVLGLTASVQMVSGLGFAIGVALTG